MTDCEPENCDAARKYVCVVAGCGWPCGACLSDVVLRVPWCLADQLQDGTHPDQPGRSAMVNRLYGKPTCPNLTAARMMRRP